MEDGVKFIFKTLIKIPCFIVIAYIIFNLFCFSITYFKMMGASYAIMQVSMENNYIPETELKSLNGYVQQFNSATSNDLSEANGTNMVSDINIITQIDSPTSGKTVVPIAGLNSSGVEETWNSNNNKRDKQYGEIVSYGLSYKYNWIWPLRSDQMFTNNGNETVDRNGNTIQGGVAGLGGGNTTIHSRAEYIMSKQKLDQDGIITFVHSVPGLQYYPDLEDK